MFEQLPSLRGFQPKFYSGGPARFHLPLLYDLVAEAKPKRAVVVGFGDGQAFFTFCQAASEQNIDCTCLAVRRERPGEPENDDIAWREGRDYGEEFYGERARFFPSSDSALVGVAHNSVDLLLLDDSDSGKEIRDDLSAWEPKLAPNAVVLFYGLGLERDDSPKTVWDEWVAVRPSAIFPAGLVLGIALQKESTPSSFLLKQLFSRKAKGEELAEVYGLAAARIDAFARAAEAEKNVAAFETRQVWLDSLLADRREVQAIIDHQGRAITELEDKFRTVMEDRGKAQLVIESLKEQVEHFDNLRRDRAKAQLIMDSQHEQLKQWVAEGDMLRAEAEKLKAQLK